MTGLNNLSSIGKDVRIRSNDVLYTMTGLNNLSSIGGDVEIKNNPLLNNLNGLDHMAAIGGHLLIYNNDSLISLMGLNNLSFVGDYAQIYSDDALMNLSGLNNLAYIGGYLEIKYNDLISCLSGLDNLTFLGGNLIIENNAALTSLTGLDNIYPGSIQNLNLYNNDVLSTCSVQSICEYLLSPNGTVSIYGNAPGCSSPAEVEETCAITAIEDKEIENGLMIVPNPAFGISDIRYQISDVGYVKLEIYDIHGQVVRVLANDSQHPGGYMIRFDASALPAGIYLVRLQAGGQVETVKMMVMR
jgi:hypothetical protein